MKIENFKILKSIEAKSLHRVRAFKDSRGRFTIGNHYWEFPRVIPEGDFEALSEFLRPPKDVYGQLHSLSAARNP